MSFNIPMHDQISMSIRNRVAKLHEDTKFLPFAWQEVSAPLIDRLTGHVLHHHIEEAVFGNSA